MDGETRGDVKEELEQLRAERLRLLMDIEQLHAANAITEKALLDTRKELLEARAEICELWGDDEPEPSFDDGLESDVRRGY